MNDLELLSRYGKVEPMDPGLIDATIEAIVHLPDQTARAPHRSRGPRRRRVSRLAVITASVAAAVAAAGIVVSGAMGSSPSRPPPPVARSGGGVLTAYVVDRSLAALATTTGYVERVVQHDSSGVRTSWRGPTQLLDEVAGHSAILWTWAPPGVDTVLSIDYQHHTWSRSAFRAPSPPPGPIGATLPPGAYLFSQKAVSGPEPDATSIAALFRLAGTEVIGTATIDGTATYELRIPAFKANGKPVTGKGLTAWIDTRTYLPVRIAPDMAAVPGPGTGANAIIPAWTQDFSWEAATSRALAIFDLEPPALFHQVNEPALQPVPPGH